jgi:hypothetical protein
VAHATDPTLWIRDLNQSPFNVGHRVQLEDFDESHVATLNELYGWPAKGEHAIARLMTLLGGHPYLVRLALFTMVDRGLEIGELERDATKENGPFAHHLQRHLNRFLANAELRDALKQILNKGICASEEVFQKLWAAGLIRGETRDQVSMKYKIYEDYARKKGL